MGAIQESANRLADAYSRLNSQWLTASAVWDDAERVWFETQYWQEYEPTVRGAMEQFRAASELVQAVRQTLEGDEG